MTTAQVSLTDEERERLRIIASRTGRTEEDLLRHAVTALLGRYEVGDRLARLRRAKGMWSKRSDLPDFTELRAKWDRGVCVPNE